MVWHRSRERALGPARLHGDPDGQRREGAGEVAGASLSTAIRVRRERFLSKPELYAFGAFSLLLVAAHGSFLWDWVARADLSEHPNTYVIASIILAALVANQQIRWWLLLAMCRPVPLAPPLSARVAVATTFVPDAEPLDMLEATLRAQVALDGEHDTWLLDEGDEPAVRELCRRLGVRHFTRHGRPELHARQGPLATGTKYGNYNAWLQCEGFARYDLLVAFDPDHIPARHFLTRVLGYFSDPTVGYVQAAQVYYNQAASLVARGAAEETYDYYSNLERALDGLGLPVVVGSHNAHRMAALREVGGFADHDADDLLITHRYRRTGWNGVYVPEILARGLTPVGLSGYLSQQRRWARSVIDLKLRPPEGGADLPLPTRIIRRLHGLNYLQPSLVWLALVCGLVRMLTTGSGPDVVLQPDLGRAAFLFGAVGVCERFRQRFFLDPAERGFHWRAGLLRFAKWPVLLWAFLDALRGHRPGYVITRKTGPASRDFLLLRAHAPALIAVAAAGLVGGLSGRAEAIVVHAAAAAYLAAGALLLALDRRPAPPAFDPALVPALEPSALRERAAEAGGGAS